VCAPPSNAASPKDPYEQVAVSSQLGSGTQEATFKAKPAQLTPTIRMARRPIMIVPYSTQPYSQRSSM